MAALNRICKCSSIPWGLKRVGCHGYVEAVSQGNLEECPHIQIVYDKFHIMKHLADALDQARRSEYQRVHEKERRLIMGQRYTLLSHQANLDPEGRKSLQMLLKAN